MNEKTMSYDIYDPPGLFFDENNIYINDVDRVFRFPLQKMFQTKWKYFAYQLYFKITYLEVDL
jgi:hypothetical protein